MFLSAFILYPVLEIIAFILVARATSWETAIALTLATSLLLSAPTIPISVYPEHAIRKDIRRALT